MMKLQILILLALANLAFGQVPPTAIDETVTPNAVINNARTLPKGKALNPLTTAEAEVVEIKNSIQIWIFEGVCPNRAAGTNVWPDYNKSTMDYLYKKSAQSPIVEPDKFHVITMGAWFHLCVDTTANTPMWMGKIVPGSAQRGNGISFATVVKWTNIFCLADCRITMRSWDNGNSLAFNPVLANYSDEVQGVRYGPSGTYGSDSLIITNGPATQLVNEIRYVGARLAYAASTQAGINLISNYVNSVTNFGLSCQVDVVQSGVVIARKIRDLPFFPMPATVDSIDLKQGMASIVGFGVSNELYYLEGSDGNGWREIALVEATDRTDQEILTPVIPSSMFYRLVQRP